MIQKILKNIAYYILGLIILSPFFFVMAWFHAYVIVKLWGWFVVPLTEWVMLTLPQAFGLSLLVSHLNPPPYTNFNQMTTEDKFDYYNGRISLPFFVLLMGYICKEYFL